MTPWRGFCDHLDAEGTIEGAPGLGDQHLPVFDCAFAASPGGRAIHWRGHVKMMAAVQPFLSGAISKTVNLPGDVTRAEIAEAYFEAWRLGLKAVAVYRDGCKRTQPLNAGKMKDEAGKADAKPQVTTSRRRLPDERQALTHKFSIAGHEGYVTVGLYESGLPGEIFITMSKEGSTISGLMDGFATSVSLALQYGVPLQVLVDKFTHTRYEPSGMTGSQDIPFAKSITDYIFRWMALRFLPRADALAAGAGHADAEEEAALDAATGTGAPADGALEAEVTVPLLAVAQANGAHGTNGHANGHGTNGTHGHGKAGGNGRAAGFLPTELFQADAPACATCGSIMVRNGACYKCLNCGSTSGCS